MSRFTKPVVEEKPSLFCAKCRTWVRVTDAVVRRQYPDLKPKVWRCPGCEAK